MTRTHIIIIGLALMLVCIGVVSAEDQWVWATEETGYPEEYIKTITPWFPSYGCSVRPMDPFVHVSHLGDSQIPGWMQEATEQMHDRPHTSGRMSRGPVRGR